MPRRLAAFALRFRADLGYAVAGDGRRIVSAGVVAVPFAAMRRLDVAPAGDIGIGVGPHDVAAGAGNIGIDGIGGEDPTGVGQGRRLNVEIAAGLDQGGLVEDLGSCATVNREKGLKLKWG